MGTIVKERDIISIDETVVSLAPNDTFPRQYDLVIPNQPVVSYFVYSASDRNLDLYAVCRNDRVIRGETYLKPEPAEKRLLEIARKELTDVALELGLPYNDLTQEKSEQAQ
jgi:hypothetical protein